MTAQLDYIRFDTDFFDKPKIKALFYRFGADGVMFFIRLLCSAGRATNAELDEEQWAAIAWESQLDPVRASEITAYCLERGLLDGTVEALSNRRVREDVEALERRRTIAREKQREKRGGALLRLEALTTEKADPANESKNIQITILEPTKENKSNVHVVEGTGGYNFLRDETPEDQSSFDLTDPHIKKALEKLETPAGQDWTRDARFVNASRRPLKKFPLIWLTPHELADVLKKLEQSNIPKTKFKDLFLKAEARIKTQKTVGRNQAFVSCYNWLTGFLMDEVIEQTIKEKRLEAANGWGKR